ncbi:MAG: N-acetyl-gamma-glutamyl-phosphate reductase [Melioribacteraceae bacterium]|nr:N-acetyl-gamma-glutamyl-phosphate reductase [Melioribacteraceae bacterium]
MISVAILGGSGYTGKHLIKYCIQHPFVDDFEIFANKSAGKSLHDIFPDLVGESDNKTVFSIEDLDLSYDLYFIALPHGESMKYVPKIIKSGKKVIDLGADYRLNDVKTYFEAYSSEHSSAQLLDEKHYGLSEYNSVYNYDLIANPGCYPTAALLSAIPITEEFGNNILSVTTVSYSGLSGAGKKVSESMLFSENYGSVKAYNVGTHRHEIEIIQELNKCGQEFNYSLTTHLLPVFSGIYSTTIIHLDGNIPQKDVDDIFHYKYSNSSFVRMRGTPPELKWVVGSNYCDINSKSVKNKIIVTAAIDNLIKGASGQAIQNMNILYGWNEQLGIKKNKEEFQNA